MSEDSCIFVFPSRCTAGVQFAGEVGIIVIGVLIALGAQQLVENWRWRSEVRETDERLREEVGYSLSNAYERLAIDACLRPPTCRVTR